MVDLSQEMNKSQELFCFETPASILVFNSNILITLMVLNILISITSITGNMLVLLTIWRSPHCCSVWLCLICVLDLYLSHLNVGFQAVLFKNSGNITSCTLRNPRTLISVFLTTVTLLTITAMSVDRYLAIHLHLRYKQVVTEEKTRNVILCVWLINSVPLIIVIFDAMASCLVMTFTIAICLVIISFAWIKIYQVVRNHQVQIQDQIAVKNHQCDQIGEIQKLCHKQFARVNHRSIVLYAISRF